MTTLPGGADEVSISYDGQTKVLSGSATYGTITSMDPFTVDGSLTINSGSSAMWAEFNVTGNLTLGPGAALAVSGGGTFDGVLYLDAGAELTVPSGTFELAAGAVVHGPGVLRVIDYGTVLVDADAAVENFTLEDSGTLSGVGTLEITQSMTWSGGTMTGSGKTLISTRLSSTAQLTIPDSFNALDLNGGRILRNLGTVDWQGETTINSWSGAARYENALGANWKMGGNGTLSADPLAGVVFVNEGTLSKTGDVGTQDATVFAGVALNSTLEVEVQVGVLQLDGGGELGNAVVLTNPGSRIELRGPTVSLLPGLVVSGQGILAIGTGEGGAATVLVNGNVSAINVELLSGTLGGPGTLAIATEMTWSGGDMLGGGTTVINGLLTVNPVDFAVLTSRRLENYGTINWSSGDWSVGFDSVIANYGDFNFLAGAGIPRDIAAFGTLENHANIIQHSTTRIAVTNFVNHGVISVQAGSLTLDLDTLLNTGHFETSTGTTVFFTRGALTFDPNINDTATYMLRGTGTFVAQASAEIIIPVNAVVEADYFELREDALIDGLGTFQPAHFTWKGGLIRTTGNGRGMIHITPGHYMLIDGVNPLVLENREIKNEGTMNWLPTSNHIVLTDQATIVVDGGIFNVWVDNKTIQDPAGTAGRIFLTNNGHFNRELTEYLGTITIQVELVNDGGRLTAAGNLNLERWYSPYGNSISVFGGGVYQTSSIHVTSGEFRLQGGEIIIVDPGFGAEKLQIGSGDPLGGPVAAYLHGTVNGRMEVSGNLTRVDLTGDLAVEKQFTQNNGAFHLNGSILTGTGTAVEPGVRIVGGTMNLDGGTLRATGAAGIHNNGTIRGNGTIDAPRIEHGATGRHIMSSAGQTGTVTVTGDYILAAGAILTFNIGGLNAGTSYDQLIIQGHVSFAGAIDVVLINGFVPTANDEFEIITFNTSDGSFDTAQIDLGNGIVFEINYYTFGVWLTAQ